MSVERRQNGPATLGGADSSLDIDTLVVLQKSGLMFKLTVPFKRWELVGQQLFSMAESSTWWIADWLAYGEAAFHDRYREAIQMTSLSYQTLRNYAWVARQFNLSRRRDTLSFGHHAEVASLGVPESDYWLRKSEEHGWSRNRLRMEVRASLRERRRECLSLCDDAADADESAPPASPLLPSANGAQRISLPLTAEQFLRFSVAASRQNMRLDEWVVGVLERASISPPALTRSELKPAALTPSVFTPEGAYQCQAVFDLLFCGLVAGAWGGTA